MRLDMLNSAGALILSAALLPACAAQRPEHPDTLNDPPTLVASFPHYGDSAISDIRLRGSVRNLDYSIAAARTDAQIIFDISLAGRSVQLRLRKEDFPEIDLRTIREGLTTEPGPPSLRFDVEFSELGGCFDTVSTPKSLFIRFDVEGQISGASLTAEGCRLVWHQLNLVQVGTSTYSATVRRE